MNSFSSLTGKSQSSLTAQFTRGENKKKSKKNFTQKPISGLEYAKDKRERQDKKVPT